MQDKKVTLQNRPPRFLKVIERGPGLGEGIRGLRDSLTVASIGAGLVSAIFGVTGPALILVDGAAGADLSQGQTVAWISAVYLFGGLISFVMGLYYKQPIVGAWSIPAAALIANNLQNYSLGEMIGAYFLASILVLALGLSGWMNKIVRWLPMPILMAMIGGVLMKYAIDTVDAAIAAPVIVGSAIVGFLLLSRFIKSIPGVVRALIFGTIAAFATGAFDRQGVDLEWVWPEITAPEFDIVTMLAVGIPLALVIQAENTQSMGILLANGYKPPVNSITTISGIASLIVAPLGGHNASIAGPMTAICGSREAGEQLNKRYGSVIVNGAIFIAFGLFASVAVVLITVLPAELITALAGLAMLTVLVSAFKGAFVDETFKLGALVALVVGISGITLFGISAPFWALLFGLATSLILEQGDFSRKQDDILVGE